MKTTLIVAILFALLIVNTPKPIFREFQAVLGLTLPAEKTSHAIFVVERKENSVQGKYHVDGREVHIQEDSIYVVLTLIDLKGPNRSFSLPAIPVTWDSLKVFYTLETVDIRYEDDNVFITGFSKGKKVISVGIKRVKPTPRPGDIT